MVKLPRLRRRAKPAAPALVDEKLYPHEYVGPESGFGLNQGPCVIERTWAGGGYIIRDVAGRRWTVNKKHVRARA
ncbi:MAG TPA: hypothetical protein VHS55_00010 [Solirubrobacteraceae bacterium]|nr:hypothetical protein [Solirubrobacteraceae bacterium]